MKPEFRVHWLSRHRSNCITYQGQIIIKIMKAIFGGHLSWFYDDITEHGCDPFSGGMKGFIWQD